MAAVMQNASTTTPGQAEAGTSLAPATAAGLPATVPATGVQTVISNLNDVFRQAAVRKAMPAIAVIIALALLGAIYAWVQETPYRAVFPGMADADQQSALEILKTANMKPRIDAGTGQLSVPAGKYHEARILLASQGVPKQQTRGVLDSLKDQSAMTTSQFMEQARYSAAIEQELAKSIGQISTIQSARVHLAQTKQSVFVRERTPVKASVVVTPFNGRVVAPTQVQAIVHLVASSVPYLSADDVSVVDNLGNLLTRRAADAGMGLTTAQVEHKQQIEETYRNRIVQLLEPVVGEGNVRSQVDLVVNFTQVETTSEDFDVRKEGSKTRSEMLSEERSSVLDPSGVPGALSNTPPPEPQTNTDTKPSSEGKDTRGAVNSKSTRNYELDKVVRHVKNQTGVLERVSVAVVIKERAPVNKDTKDAKDAKDAKGAADTEGGYTKEEIERLQGLVRGVVGFDEKRGDSVTIVPAKFEVGPGPGSMIPWYENDMVVSSLKVGLATFVLIALLFTVVRPVVRAYLPQPPAPVVALAGPEGEQAQAAEGEAAAAAGEGEGAEYESKEDGVTMAEGESLDDFKARLKASAAPKKSSISADMLDTANTYDDKVALIRMLVQEDSGRVASVLKGMIKRDLAG